MVDDLHPEYVVDGRVQGGGSLHGLWCWEIPDNALDDRKYANIERALYTTYHDTYSEPVARPLCTYVHKLI